MLTLTQVLLPVVLFSSAVFSLPLTDDGEETAPYTGEYGFPEDFNYADEDRINGGHEAAIGQFPFIVSIRNTGFWHGAVHVCGGSIITNRFVVTAAHCFVRMFPEPRHYLVVAGAHRNVSGNDGTAYNITRWIRHEGFFVNFTQPNPRVQNDVALIQTATAIRFNNLVRAIPLHRGFIGGGLPVTTSGWGSSSDRVRSLKFVHMNTVTNAECRRRFLAESNIPAPVHDWDTICPFSGKEGHGVCSGDSGGPLTYQNRLIGITSWARGGLGRCGRGVPDGFMRISNYLQWFDRHIQSSL